MQKNLTAIIISFSVMFLGISLILNRLDDIKLEQRVQILEIQTQFTSVAKTATATSTVKRLN